MLKVWSAIILRAGPGRKDFLLEEYGQDAQEQPKNDESASLTGGLLREKKTCWVAYNLKGVVSHLS